MISNLFHLFFYNPIYNLLVTLVHIIPGGDVGIAVIIITVLIRLLLLPFFLSAARMQHVMGAMEPKLKEIKEKHKHDKEQQAKKTMELYKEANVNPFASFATVLLQAPILIALYMVFRYEAFPTIDTNLLYSFVTVPHTISMHFLGLINVAGKSIVLAALAGVAQYAQATLMMHRTNAAKQHSAKTGTAADMTRVMNTQMRFVFPFIIAVVAYSTSGAIALYFVTTNAFGALQEVYLRRELLGAPKDNETVAENSEKPTA